jgi:hypothetical protein
MVRAGLLVPCGLAAMGTVACGQAAPGSAAPPTDEFQSPRRVEILGYGGSAMEPFISCDGRYLFFNNRNDPGEQTDVLFAERAENDAFRFLGPVPGVNQPPPVLDAVPSMNAQGELFFISTRSYETTLSTVHAGEFRDARVASVRLVPGNFSLKQRGWLTMDAEVSRDGGLLYFANARFAGGSVPEEADLAVARRAADAFVVTDDSRVIFANVNSRALEYAPATSVDGLELFFTRLDGLTTVILRARRTDVSMPFGPPEPVAALSGFVEAPSLSCDGGTLYYHQREGGEFFVFRVSRAR